MKLIAAVDKNWGIGYRNKLLVSIPEDKKYFQQLTMGKTIILGRKTLQTFPGELPLAGRKNIILTKNSQFQVRGGICCHSVEEVLEIVDGTEEVFVVGGESVYRQFLPFVNEAYITYIDYSYQADAYMTRLEKEKDWKLVEESEEQTYFSLEYYFRKYRKI